MEWSRFAFQGELVLLGEPELCPETAAYPVPPGSFLFFPDVVQHQVQLIIPDHVLDGRGAGRGSRIRLPHFRRGLW